MENKKQSGVIKIQITRYKCQCGKKFAKKYAAEHHEKVCKCWTNPKNRSCKTCKFGSFINDSNGMEHEPQFLQKWTSWHCSKLSNEAIEQMSKPATFQIKDLRIHCAHHETKCKN